MNMNDNRITALCEHVAQATVEYRKGAEVTERAVGDMRVTEVYAMPPVPGKGVLVDVHFVKIGFTEAADRATFERLLSDALRDGGRGEFVDMTAETLRGGPSYITLGGWLGSQDLALRFLALGQLHGLWTVVTPESIHVPESKWNEMAGAGFVMFAPSAALAELVTA